MEPVGMTKPSMTNARKTSAMAKAMMMPLSPSAHGRLKGVLIAGSGGEVVIGASVWRVRAARTRAVVRRCQRRAGAWGRVAGARVEEGARVRG